MINCSVSKESAVLNRIGFLVLALLLVSLASTQFDPPDTKAAENCQFARIGGQTRALVQACWNISETAHVKAFVNSREVGILGFCNPTGFCASVRPEFSTFSPEKKCLEFLMTWPVPESPPNRVVLMNESFTETLRSSQLSSTTPTFAEKQLDRKC